MNTDVSQPTTELAQLLGLLNQNRFAVKLEWCPRLALAASYQTQDMVAMDVAGVSQHHLTSEGGSVQDYTFYANKAGYDTTLGNLSAQYYLGTDSTTLAEVANTWSPVRATAQTSNYNVVGMAHVGHHWTELYGRKDNSTAACMLP